MGDLKTNVGTEQDPLQEAIGNHGLGRKWRYVGRFVYAK